MTLSDWKQLIEYFGGAVDAPPSAAPAFLAKPLVRALWWATAIALITMFSGQTSKFIYIDF